MFDNILNWKLLCGSHGFPGPDGGTCINEAAIVAAGFEYRRVCHSSSCPPCFSQPISAFCIGINDAMPDDLRQELLMPFVTRLAGTRDKRSVEVKRAKLIVFRTIREVLPVALRQAGLWKHADRCLRSNDFNSAAHFLFDHRYMVDALNSPVSERSSRQAIVAVMSLLGGSSRIIRAVSSASDLIEDIAEKLYLHDRAAVALVFRHATLILDEAIKLGRQAEPVETAQVVKRMEKAKRREPVEAAA